MPLKWVDLQRLALGREAAEAHLCQEASEKYPSPPGCHSCALNCPHGPVPRQARRAAPTLCDKTWAFPVLLVRGWSAFYCTGLKRCRELLHHPGHPIRVSQQLDLNPGRFRVAGFGQAWLATSY